MLGHLGVNVADLRAAKRYYDTVMPLLGYSQFISATDQFAYRPADGKPGTYIFFYPALELPADEPAYSRHRPGLQHLAFMVNSRTEVDAVHHKACELVAEFGGQVLHTPQHFPQYPPPYFATFWLDPWGVMLEAVCHYDRP